MLSPICGARHGPLHVQPANDGIGGSISWGGPACSGRQSSQPRRSRRNASRRSMPSARVSAPDRAGHSLARERNPRKTVRLCAMQSAADHNVAAERSKFPLTAPGDRNRPRFDRTCRRICRASIASIAKHFATRSRSERCMAPFRSMRAISLTSKPAAPGAVTQSAKEIGCG